MDKSLKDLGNSVKRVRRTAKNELLLELKKASESNTVGFQSAVISVLGDSVRVAALTHSKTVVIKDLDEITSEQEICEALRLGSGINNLEKGNVRMVGGKQRGLQIAFVKLAASDADKLLNTGKIRIGWSICRIMECVEPKRCIKCWRFGHIAANCKFPEDRSKSCRRCGEEGHFAAACSKDSKCILCGGKHAVGNARCPEFKKAVDKVRK
ncbi:cellular nucleic acid-binding protein-like [Teleopsis dalmanni]|uniref:cellular nucleic acid-binding protein-like n=1 Tax=Teleopsis dalmanni TaxID=139649 RepID=UPI0018CF154B|nr:cellular nucleic acid-binding protein-like [Teleopsis dalmanni]